MKELTAFALALLLAAPMTHAQTAYTYVNNSTGWRSNQPMEINPIGFIRAASETSLGYNGLTGHVSVGGLSEYGTAKAYATGSREGFYGLSQAGWYDWLKIDGGPLLNGKQGMLSFAIGYDWRLAYNELAPFQASASVQVNLGSALATVKQSPTVECQTGFGCITFNADTLYSFASSGAFAATTGTVSNAGATGVAYFSMPFTFGATTFLNVSIIAAVGSHIGSSDLSVSRGGVFADHSLNWGGIQAVQDASGNAVTYQTAATSAFDYTRNLTTPVPEPSAAALLLLGLAGLGVWTRRRAGAAA
jgi:hypothetical protein